MKRFFAFFLIVGMTLSLGAYLSSGSAQEQQYGTFHGRKILIPESSISRSGRIHTNYFFVGSREFTPQPPQGAETPGSLACVYQLVSGPTGCPINTATNVPTGGVGAIAIIDAGDYPSAASDLEAFDNQFGIPAADFTVVYAGGTKPPVYQDWEVEEALDIEWAHAMAPKAKLFLVESVLCTAPQCTTDPTWQAVAEAGKLVSQNGGGVVSMSWGIAEFPQEVQYDKYFTAPGVVYFAASGDSGIGVSSHPAASPNVVAVGGTYFNRDGNGNFVNEQYYTGGGGGDISPYEPIPTYQNIIANIVGTHRGYPDVASDFCCTAIYLQGWGEVGGTSWSSPTFAGIVNAAGRLGKSSNQGLTQLYAEYGSGQAYKSGAFYDITTGDPNCKTGWDLCAGVGSPRTYKGK
ncbi:MAG TPA: S53 family peptidase [Terriglobales bacterium]|nr:S53 family peptidase [Terriglobales bacterium]